MWSTSTSLCKSLHEADKQSWHKPAITLTACAAVVTLASTVSPSFAWSATSSTRTIQGTTPVVGAPLSRQAFRSASQVGNVGEPQAWSAQQTGKAFNFAAGATFCFGAALALARQLLTSKPEALAMLSSAGEGREESKEKMRLMVNSLNSTDMQLLSRGGAMTEVVRSKGIDEVAAAIRADQLSRKDLTPKDVLLEMQRGNGRFWMGLSERPDMTALERRALIMAQAPKMAILSCSDSRVPVEIIFDQGLGEIFVVRMAGNILDATAHGSLEFAVKYLGVKVLMVLGHEACGAVKGAITMSQEAIAKEPFDLQVVLQNIKSNLNIPELNAISDGRSRDREAIVLNTSNQVKKLQQNQVFAEKVQSGDLLICGAFYEISSGIVDFFSLDKNGLVIDV